MLFTREGACLVTFWRDLRPRTNARLYTIHWTIPHIEACVARDAAHRSAWQFSPGPRQ